MLREMVRGVGKIDHCLSATRVFTHVAGVREACANIIRALTIYSARVTPMRMRDAAGEREEARRRGENGARYARY